MMRTTLLDSARRAYNVVRGTLQASDDKPKMQTVDVRLMHGELLTKVERFQPYGHSSVPLPPDQDGKAAEVIAIFANGNRSHPVVIAVDDRRYRPKNWSPGDAGLYHFKGATARLTNDGWKHDAGPDKKPHIVTVGNATFTIADGKITAKVGSGDTSPSIVIKPDMIYLGEDPDKGGTFDFVSTVSGPSVNVKAKIG